MTISHPVRLGATALLMSTISTMAASLAYAQEADLTLDPITVEGQQSVAQAVQTAQTYAFDPALLPVPAGLDGGALLSSVPGVAGSRMGGHGIDIIIRGMQGNQLNIIDAGSFTYGGCPNRMDPPSAMASFYRADEVVVERGYASVTSGPGGSGGTVRLERAAPDFEEGKIFSGDLLLGGSSNGNGLSAAGTLSADLGNGFYAELSGEHKEADNYEDGNGDEVRSAFTQNSAGLTLGYAANGTDLALDIEKDEALDTLFGGANMDSPSSETLTYRLRGGTDVDMGALTRIEGVLYSSEVDHVMDNYSLRTNMMPMVMRVPTTSDTLGGKLEGQFDFGATKAKIGVDYQSNNRIAYAYRGSVATVEAEDPNAVIALMWPDVTIEQTGLYAETETALSEVNTLKFGLRYDHVRSTIDDADGNATYPNAVTPNDVYTSVYGVSYDGAVTEDNFGGLMRFEHRLDPDTMLFAGLSRSVRTADANERAMARQVGTTIWAGNPDIAPEKHNQFDLGIEITRADWGLNATAYVDKVEDYILRQTVGTVTSYSNVSALLAGVEIGGHVTSGAWTFAGNLAYTYGENRSDDKPLGQIPPLMGALSASYDAGIWQAGARVNFAAAQDRIDPLRDASTTPGYATLDLFGAYEISDTVMLIGGVDNLFDKAYANHLNRETVLGESTGTINEPGRNVYLTLQVQF
ncbi:TonB-dependent receptor domain-containing protein [Celeribacter neptunius]|uniref:Iron complex outermembrane recepter protein n=1 Tax=Celeribacter neptunius TaxID=588602 RepID=A0A1I3IM02_9RHOB|nr:TonB-dependent receptor [Celeribacter neptunius]SFI48966.1 iron complex outermembrane recepter protein [Celeribacter neptunius]